MPKRTKRQATPRTPRTVKKRKAELCHLIAQSANIRESCEAARLPRRTFYQWKQDDPEFAAAVEAAMDIGTDALEDEAVRRAERGWLEPVWHQGEEVGYVRKYSDTLLIFLLKGRRPEKFAERRIVDHNVKYADPYEDLDRRYGGRSAATGKARVPPRVN